MANKETKHIVLGLGWTTLSTIVSGLTQILRLSILARFLSKEDFGIVAILTFVLGLTQVFSDMGFSAAIMSEKQLSRKSFLSLYWLQFIVFNSLMIVVSLFSPIISNYYEQPVLRYLIPIALFELFFVSTGKLYDTVLQKNMLFKTMAIRNIVSAIFSLFLAIGLAYVGCGVYSLIISTLSHAAVVHIWNFIAGQKTYKISLKNISLKEAGSLVKVGLYQMGTQLVDYVASKLDILLISSFLGVGALGIYNLAKELVLRFVMIINTITTKVMLPVMSSYSNNLELLKYKFKQFVTKLSYLNTPIVGFVFLFAAFIVEIFYGKGYEEANSIVSIMSIWSLFVVLGQPSGMVAIVLKRTDLSFSYTIIRFLTMGILLFAFARKSLYGAALTMLFTYLVMFFVNWYMLLYRIIKMSFKEYFFVFSKSWGIVLVSIIVVLIIRYISIFEGKYAEGLFELFIYLISLLLFITIFDKSILSPIYQRIKRIRRK
jgi:O-antigen/teichoic acid export membrane protein